jgi:tRNA G18 (ribose-2'-O)-methylase SpoU
MDSIQSVTKKLRKTGVQINVLKLYKARESLLNVSCAVGLAMSSIRAIMQNCETEYLPKQ